jgi:mxaC protein
VLRALLRAAGALSVVALIVASAAPFLEGGTQTLSGQGAEIVIVLDRSGSMSEPLIGTGDAGSIRGETHVESKIEAARRILLAFMQRRPADTFGMVTFNASPIGVAPLGEDRNLVESALISAEARSEGYTAPARALGLALDYFRDRQLTASRVVLLVSDGGATISSENRAKLSFEDVDALETESNGAPTEERIQLFRQVKRAHELIASEVDGANDHALRQHLLRDPTIV